MVCMHCHVSSESDIQGPVYILPHSFLLLLPCIRRIIREEKDIRKVWLQAASSDLIGVSGCRSPTSTFTVRSQIVASHLHQQLLAVRNTL